MEPLIFIAVMVGLMWLLVLRPQRRRTSELTTMIAGLSVGDEIVTAGGMYGRIKRMDSDVLTVEIAPDITVRVARASGLGRDPARGRGRACGSTGRPRRPLTC